MADVDFQDLDEDIDSVDVVLCIVAALTVVAIACAVVGVLPVVAVGCAGVLSILLDKGFN